jgi:hypothetical protein
LFYGCNKITIEDNIIDTHNPSSRIRFRSINPDHSGSLTVECFNNTTAAGDLVRGYSDDSGWTSEIATTLDDVNCLAL